MLRVLIKTNPSIQPLIMRKIKLIQLNPNDTRLNNHPLRKRLKGKWAFSITDDIRIIYKWYGKNSVSFLAIGGHSEVYQ